MKSPEFFMVWRDGSDGNTPSYRHSTYQSALKEAERLARLHGGKFHVLTQSATVEKIDVKVTEYDGIPF